MIALPGNYALHVRAVQEAADRAARADAIRAAQEPKPRTVELIDVRDLRPGDVITWEDGTRVHAVRDVTDVNGRTNMARVWTTTGQPITYSGQVHVSRPASCDTAGHEARPAVERRRVSGGWLTNCADCRDRMDRATGTSSPGGPATVRGTDAMTFPAVLAYALGEARELIRDGAADDLTTADLTAAEAALALAAPGSAQPTPAQVDAIAQVAALGAEYLANVDRDDDEEAADVVNQLRGGSSHGVAAVRWWYANR